MPGLVPSIHVLFARFYETEDVDGRDEARP
jgi:hypothetical protein